MKTPRTIITIPHEQVDTKEFDNVEVYDKEFVDVTYPMPLKCFPGAWYHKVVSSKDDWLGIEGLVKLGEFIPDDARFNLDGKMRYMDNHNLYMGGSSILESDAGVGYNTMYTSPDTKDDLTISSPKLGYRPFFRFIVKERIEDGGNVDVINSNYWRVSDPRDFEYYYFPGDIIRMKVYSPIKDYLQLKIEVVEETKIKKYVDIRNNLKVNHPKDFISPLFHSAGHGYHKAEFKRVNSIDQYNNEGLDAKKNSSKVLDEVWYETYLYRRIDNKLYKIPLNSSRQAAANFPDERCVKVKKFNKEIGGEIVEIDPTGL